MRLKNSKTIVLPQLTLHNTSSLRVRTYAHKEKECFVPSKASDPLSKPDKSVFDFPAAHRNISFGGQV